MTGLAAWALAAYLLGAIPSSMLAARYVAGVDLRRTGSGNLGATNLYRVLGWRYAIPVALFDAAKGTIPVLLFARWAGTGTLGALLFGLAAIAGHVFSVFAQFRGGKGVATSAGVVLGLAPLAFLMALVAWAVVLWVTGYSSLSSILAAVVFPFAVALIYPGNAELLWFGVAMAGFITLLHRANIRRLLGGTESRFGRKPDQRGSAG